jgi:hypothetical protein
VNHDIEIVELGKSYDGIVAGMGAQLLQAADCEQNTNKIYTT